MPSPPSRPRVCAVSYLNTVPLVWGMLEGPQRNAFDVSFAVPSVCAERLRNGEADIGIVPVVSLLEQRLEIFRGTGIACRGAVRTILLISKVPFADIRLLAADSGSRSSVMLSRIILSSTYRAHPALITMPPRLNDMLEAADAALIIGDAALIEDPDELRARGLRVMDLGAEWMELSGLPLVTAVWAGRAEVHSAEAERAFVDSYRFGMAHIDDIVAREHAQRGVTPELARKYLTEYVIFELGDIEYRGMEKFLEAAARLAPARYVEPITASLEK